MKKLSGCYHAKRVSHGGSTLIGVEGDLLWVSVGKIVESFLEEEDLII